MKLLAITQYLEELYPLNLAENWDHPGLIVGNPEYDYPKIVLLVDPEPAVIAKMLKNASEPILFISHHPLFFRAVNKLGADTFRGKLIANLIKSGSALYNAHTNADISKFGVSDALSEMLDLQNVMPIIPNNFDKTIGLGRVGDLQNAQSLESIAQSLADILPKMPNISRIKVSAGENNDIRRQIRRIAVLGGSGDAYFDEVEASNADLYITSDLRHHPVLDAKYERSFAIIDLPHFLSEFPWLSLVKAKLSDKFTDLDIQISETITDPWDLMLK